ncbi:MAG: DsrE family protein [Chloroflexi bacterium]|nr:DsrE family protein [Chloroflexota bacterium]
MAEETKISTTAGEECDECAPDLSKLRERRQEDGAAHINWWVLIMLTRGTYGHWDDGFSAIQVGNAVLAVEEGATLLLIDDGVYFAARGQDPSEIGLTNNISFIRDFLDLGGRMLALDTSLAKRGLSAADLLEEVQIINARQMVGEIEKHQVSVTF